jgi:hypothetical protein
VEYGERPEGRKPTLGELMIEGEPRPVAEAVPIGLYRADGSRGEIFPPSEGDVAVGRDVVVFRKRRAVRERSVQPTPSGPFAMVSTVSVKDKGWQWFRFRLEEVRSTGRTMLLRHRMMVEDDVGRYEVVLGSDQGSRRVAALVRQRAGA